MNRRVRGQRRLLLLLVVALAGAGCKRTPRDHKGRAGGDQGGVEPEALRGRVQMMGRIDFRKIPTPILEMILPTALRDLVKRCEIDFARDLGKVEVEVAGPLMYRMSSDGALTRQQIACALDPVLEMSGRRKASVYPRPDGGLEVMTADMPVHMGLRGVLGRRLAEAPADHQIAMAIRGEAEGNGVMDTLLWLGDSDGALRIRYPTRKLAEEAKLRLAHVDVAHALIGQEVSVNERELIIAGPVLPLTMSLGPAVMETFGTRSEAMTPAILPGDDYWYVKSTGPYHRPYRRGDVVVYKCADTGSCGGRVLALPGERALDPAQGVEVAVPPDHLLLGADNGAGQVRRYQGLQPFDKVQGRAILIWWSQHPTTLEMRWNRIWQFIQ